MNADDQEVVALNPSTEYNKDIFHLPWFLVKLNTLIKKTWYKRKTEAGMKQFFKKTIRFLQQIILWNIHAYTQYLAGLELMTTLPRHDGCQQSD